MYKAIIVDDEQIIVEGLSRLICWEEFGIELLKVTTNPFEALSVITDTHVDILVTDISMPGMTGLELIERAKAAVPKLKSIIVCGYNDFDFVRQALLLGVENYLLKPVNINEFSMTLVTVTEKLDYDYLSDNLDRDVFTDNLLNRWLSNNIYGPDLKSRAKFIGLSLNENEYLVCACKIVNATSDIMQSAGLVCDMVCEQFKGSISHLVFADFNHDCIIIFNEENLENRENEIKAILCECLNAIKSRFDFDVFFSYGSVEQGYTNTHKSYRKAKDTLDYCRFMTPNKIVTYDNIIRLSNYGATDSLVDMDVLLRYIRSKDRDNAINYVDELYRRIKKEGKYTYIDVQFISLSILLSISKAVNLPFDQMSSIVPINSDNLEFIAEGIKQEIIRVIEMAEKQDMEINPVIKRTLQYIQDNYKSDFSLKTLSYHLNVNASYLGQTFKKATGKLFSDYLNKVRIEHAKEMLINTNLKISDIAESVGYNNQNYFIKMFKREARCSPSEFRNREIQNQTKL